MGSAPGTVNGGLVCAAAAITPIAKREIRFAIPVALLFWGSPNATLIAYATYSFVPPWLCPVSSVCICRESAIAWAALAPFRGGSVWSGVADRMVILSFETTGPTAGGPVATSMTLMLL